MNNETILLEDFFTEVFINELENDCENNQFSFFKVLETVETLIKILCETNHLENNQHQYLNHGLNYIYIKPNYNRVLFAKIIELIKSSSFINRISEVLRDLSDLGLLKVEGPARQTFILINKIIISYADDSIEFRKIAFQSDLFKVLLDLVNDKRNSLQNLNQFEVECINLTIKSIYNIVRLNDYEYKFLIMKHKVSSILLEIIPLITDDSTRVCAVLCIAWTFNENEFEKNFDVLIKNIELGVIIAFGLFDKAIHTGNKNKEKMFRCFLGEVNRLPFFWAHEIADGIAKWSSKYSVRQLIVKNQNFFNYFIQLYVESESILEKKSALNAISRLIVEPSLRNIIRCNQRLRHLFQEDLRNNNLIDDIVIINFKINLDSVINLEYNLYPDGIKNFESNMSKFSEVLDCLSVIFLKYSDSIIYKQYFKCFKSEIYKYVIIQNQENECVKIALKNYILICLKKYFFNKECIFHEFQGLNNHEIKNSLAITTSIPMNESVNQYFSDKNCSISKYESNSNQIGFTNSAVPFKNEEWLKNLVSDPRECQTILSLLKSDLDNYVIREITQELNKTELIRVNDRVKNLKLTENLTSWGYNSQGIMKTKMKTIKEKRQMYKVLLN